MPPAENTPDFDSMSPEELMAWMESLAKRQGAVEGFTTAADVEVPEVDPASAQVDEPGYVPFGMDPEKWKVKLAEEEAAKAARKTGPLPAQPTPAKPFAAPIPATPVPPAPIPAAVSASGAPDFDSMSPEELMAWMESLAKRQGAVEGFTTAADVEVPEVDPASAQVDEPGYVPFGMDPEKWKVKLAEEEAAKAARKTGPLPAQPTPAVPEPALPSLELPPLEAEEDLASTELAPAITDDAMAWLENLAVDQGALPQLDLSSLELEPLATEMQTPAAGDPMAWLESLAESDEGVPSLDLEAATEPPAAVVDPLESGVDPVQWLESLAKRQGASEEELVTSADLNIPVPQGIADTGPGYQDYTFESEDASEELPVLSEVGSLSADLESSEFDDPEAWLESLAAAQGESHSETARPKPTGGLGDDEVIAALNKGADISPEEMQAWMERQFERAEQLGDELEPEIDPDAPAVRAELPDWLLEQMGTPPVIEEQPPARVEEKPPLVEQIAEPAPAQMPDWLKSEEPEELDIKSIFAETEEEPAASLAAAVEAASLAPSGEELQIDVSDPWVVAFEQERVERLSDVTKEPEWYAERLKEGAGDTPLPPQPAAPGVPLQPAALQPEAELAAGQPEAMPDWLSDFTPAQEAAAVAEELPDWLREHAPTPAPAPVASEELPEWLKQAAVEPEHVPDWLMETLGTEEAQAVKSEEAAKEAPAPVPAPAPVRPPVSPVPVPPAARIDVAAALNSARTKSGAGDIDGCLQDYEAVIRANTQLDAVVADLSKLIEDKKHKENPAVYRVLGDGLMRQGKLQTALDTYRKALNLL